MGRGFGRGAKSVAIVTHAQLKSKAKKLPKGLRVNKKRAKRLRMNQADDEDPNQMLQTKVAEQSSRRASTMQRLDAQIAAIHIPENVAGRGKLKHLRKQIVSQVRDLRRKHHKRQEKLNKQDRGKLAADHEEAIEERNARRRRSRA